MSFYHARSKRPPDAEAEVNVRNGAVPAPATTLPFAPPPQNCVQLRKARPVEHLLPASVKWLESLPHDVWPVALVNKYPRIVNLIAQQWNDYDSCCAYFGVLFTDRRGTRRGFPADVHRELRKLFEHYQRLRLAAGGNLSLV
jgi:hypothetical protein